MHLLVLFVLLAALAPNMLAAEAASPSEPFRITPAGTNLSLSFSSGKRASWQQRLTLGPGDTVNLALFDQPDTARTDVPIGPDGHITFLQARDLQAAGLTIDELRARLDESLARFYRSPHTVVTPAVIRSKKYFVLGSVPGAGVYIFDRPLTVIEAIARAGGLETGLSEQRSVELTDLGHSFLVRKGERLPVDFERLFQRGDLTQNVALEPNDYLYFASASANEIYVLGEVVSPGVVAFMPKPTVLSVIAARNGYTPRAFKSRVLVVRGSLDHPESFIVDTRAILSGQEPDFKLQPKDIVYVSQNPWKIAAEIVDLAVRTFVQGFAVETATLKVGPIFNWPNWGGNRSAEPLIK